MSDIAAPSEWVECIAGLRLPPTLDGRVQQLMDRNNEGKLSEAERLELESLVEMSEILSVVRAKAILLLGQAPM